MADQYINNMSVTWNDGGTTFAGIKKNVTDTASAADSKLLDLLVGGVSKFYVGKVGGAFASDESVFYDPADPTKRVRLDAGGVTSGQTRVLTLPDRNFELGKGWEFISVANPVSAAAVDFTDLSAYRTLRLTGRLTPATDAVNLYLRTDANNGASFDAGASDYQWQGMSAASTTVAGVGATEGQIQINTGSNVGNVAQEGVSFSIVATDFNIANYARFHGTVQYKNASSTLVGNLFSAIRLDTTPRDAIRLLFSSGNISGGYVILEGIRG